MSNLFYYFPVPVNYHQNEQNQLHSITHQGISYFIELKNFYYILSRINMLDDFINYSESDDNFSISKWLNSKKLMDEDFLAGIAEYSVKNTSFKTLSNYECFSKNEDNIPKLDNAIKTSFFGAIVFDSLFEHRIEFNSLVSRKLDMIEKELKSINQITKFKKQKNKYKERILLELLDFFAPEDDLRVMEEFAFVKNLSFDINTFLSPDEDLEISKVSGIKNSNRKRIHSTGGGLKECLKAKTLLKMNMKYKKSCFLFLDFESLMKKSMNFTKYKLEFEKNYVYNLLSDANEEYWESFNTFKDSSIAINGSISVKSKSLNISRNIDILYSSVESTNCLFDTKDQLMNFAVLLNLNSPNLHRIKSMFFSNEYELEQKYLTFSLKKPNDHISPFGYAKVDYL